MLSAVAVALWVATAAALAWAGWCAFTSGLFQVRDYGNYANMLWNCGHGRPFRFLVDRTYLDTHLSFSLAMLGPLFRLWDHPLLPWVAQLALAFAGAGFLAASARRLGVAREVAWALGLVPLAHPFAQQALLGEFHGVTLLLALLPALHHCARFRRHLVGLPLALCLGLREDAFVAAVPVLLYVAAADRWRAGYAWAAAAAAYGAFAVLVLYPALAGRDLLGVRAGYLPGANPGAWGAAAWRARGVSLAWLALPALPLLARRGWLPLVALLALPLAQAFGSALPAQYALAKHYPAPAVAALGVALVEAAARQRAGGSSRASCGLAAWLLAALAGAHVLRGLAPGGGAARREYRRPDPAGVATLAAALRIPREGVLLCPAEWCGFVANRADLLYRIEPGRFDLVFLPLGHAAHRRGRDWRPLLGDDAFGVRDFDGERVLLGRGFPTNRNAEVRAAFAARTQPLPAAPPTR